MNRTTADFLRIFSMLGVLIIHSAGSFEENFLRAPGLLNQDFLAVVISQFFRFCVPLFILLSGYGLYEREKILLKNIKKESLFQFYYARSLRIIVPYLLVTFMFTAFTIPWSLDGALIRYLHQIPLNLLRGSGDYHLYFIPIILQCYLLFPLLRRVISWKLVILCFFVSLIFASPSHLIFRQLGWERYDPPAYLVICWLFYFVLGMMLSKSQLHVETASKGFLYLKNKWSWPIYLVTLVGLILEYLHGASLYPSPSWFNHFNRWVVIFYVLACVLLFLKYDSWLNQFFTNRRAAFLMKWSALTFPAYLFHTQILRVLGSFELAKWFVVKFVLLIVLTLSFVWILDKLLKINSLRILFGFEDLRKIKP